MIRPYLLSSLWLFTSLPPHHFLTVINIGLVFFRSYSHPTDSPSFDNPIPHDEFSLLFSPKISLCISRTTVSPPAPDPSPHDSVRREPYSFDAFANVSPLAQVHGLTVLAHAICWKQTQIVLWERSQNTPSQPSISPRRPRRTLFAEIMTTNFRSPVFPLIPNPSPAFHDSISPGHPPR